MLIPETVIKLITVIYALLALFGAYLVAYTAYSTKKVDNTLLRAKAFLSESFLKDSWKLIFLTCVLFLIHAVFELNKIFGLSIEESFSEFVKELTELGIIICIVISAYKWFKLIHPNELVKVKSDSKGKSLK